MNLFVRIVVVVIAVLCVRSGACMRYYLAGKLSHSHRLRQSSHHHPLSSHPYRRVARPPGSPYLYALIRWPKPTLRARSPTQFPVVIRAFLRCSKQTSRHAFRLVKCTLQDFRDLHAFLQAKRSLQDSTGLLHAFRTLCGGQIQLYELQHVSHSLSGGLNALSEPPKASYTLFG